MVEEIDKIIELFRLTIKSKGNFCVCRGKNWKISFVIVCWSKFLFDIFSPQDGKFNFCRWSHLISLHRPFQFASNWERIKSFEKNFPVYVNLQCPRAIVPFRTHLFSVLWEIKIRFFTNEVSNGNIYLQIDCIEDRCIWGLIYVGSLLIYQKLTGETTFIIHSEKKIT